MRQNRSLGPLHDIIEVREKSRNHLKNLALRRKKPMYKKDRHHQFSLSDLNQPIGLKMNPENR